MIRSPQEHPVLRVATWNIHKGVQGVGPAKRLEIHNIGHAVEQLDADLVCLQEVRWVNRREQRRFVHWPEQPQADFLAPKGMSRFTAPMPSRGMANMATRCCHAGQ